MVKNYVYYRCSTDKQDYEQQINYVRSYCEQTGLTISGVFEEKEHGTVTSSERVLNELIDICLTGDRIIVSEFSRVTRLGPYETLKISEKLTLKGASIYCVKENISIGTDDRTASEAMFNTLMMTFVSSTAKLERENISTRTKSALQAKKDRIHDKGFFISKKGVHVYKLGNPALDKAVQTMGGVASGKKRSEALKSNPVFMQAYKTAKMLQGNGERLNTISEKLADIGIKTVKNQPYTPIKVHNLLTIGDRYYIEMRT